MVKMNCPPAGQKNSKIFDFKLKRTILIPKAQNIDILIPNLGVEDKVLN